jgi:hypothetical protein
MLDGTMRKTFGENGMRKVNLECAPEVVGSQTRAVYRLAINGRLPLRTALIEKHSSSESSS